METSTNIDLSQASGPAKGPVGRSTSDILRERTMTARQRQSEAGRIAAKREAASSDAEMVECISFSLNPLYEAADRGEDHADIELDYTCVDLPASDPEYCRMVEEIAADLLAKQYERQGFKTEIVTAPDQSKRVRVSW